MRDVVHVMLMVLMTPIFARFVRPLITKHELPSPATKSTAVPRRATVSRVPFWEYNRLGAILVQLAFRTKMAPRWPFRRRARIADLTKGLQYFSGKAKRK